jgi:hypothetical protein
MAISLEYARAQEEMMRRRHWEEQQRQMMNAGAYYDMNREMFVVPREQAAGKEVPKPVPSRAASDPLAFMDNQANKVLLTQGEM